MSPIYNNEKIKDIENKFLRWNAINDSSISQVGLGAKLYWSFLAGYNQADFDLQSERVETLLKMSEMRSTIYQIDQILERLVNAYLIPLEEYETISAIISKHITEDE